MLVIPCPIGFPFLSVIVIGAFGIGLLFSVGLVSVTFIVVLSLVESSTCVVMLVGYGFTGSFASLVDGEYFWFPSYLAVRVYVPALVLVGKVYVVATPFTIFASIGLPLLCLSNLSFK